MRAMKKAQIDKRVSEVLEDLKALSSVKSREGMARFGIETKYALGVSVTNLRKVARRIGRDHRLALALWKTKIHEARILSSMIDDPQVVSERQMERWVKAFDSWDLCDECCGNLFDKTEYAYKKVVEWCGREEEFVKRAGYVMMATLSVHDKEAKDEQFVRFMPLIKKGADDERNFVKKAVNWALRQIGKRNLSLNKVAIRTGKEIKKIDSKAARWIASDALRELQSEAVIERFKR